mgnify:CR=1 FL=1
MGLTPTPDTETTQQVPINLLIAAAWRLSTDRRRSGEELTITRIDNSHRPYYTLAGMRVRARFLSTAALLLLPLLFAPASSGGCELTKEDYAALKESVSKLGTAAKVRALKKASPRQYEELCEARKGIRFVKKNPYSSGELPAVFGPEDENIYLDDDELTLVEKKKLTIIWHRKTGHD